MKTLDKPGTAQVGAPLKVQKPLFPQTFKLFTCQFRAFGE